MKAELEQKKAVKVWSSGGSRFYECPLTAVTSETNEALALVYLIEDSKHLLFDGGWAAQPRWLYEAWGIFKAEQTKAIKEKSEHGRERP